MIIDARKLLSLYRKGQASPVALNGFMVERDSQNDKKDAVMAVGGCRTSIGVMDSCTNPPNSISRFIMSSLVTRLVTRLVRQEETRF